MHESSTLGARWLLRILDENSMEANEEVHNNKYDALREHCWDQALNTFATGFIFDRKSKKLTKQLHMLTFLGLLIPLAAGGVILLFELSSPNLKYLVWFAGGLSLSHAILTLWSIVRKWSDRMSYANESSRHNYRISDTYVYLAKTIPKDFDIRLEILENENKFRMDLDYQQEIEEKEKRYGMRAALRQFDSRCAECGEIPYSMKSTDCNVCGNFDTFHFPFLL